MKRVSFILLVSALLISPAIADDNKSQPPGYRHESSSCSEQGEGDDLPKFYPLLPFELKSLPSYATLAINEQGEARLILLISDTEKLSANSKKLEELDQKTAATIFGSSTSSKETSKTFHVLGTNPNGPNIFHVDMEFNDQQLLTKYRVRGFGISKPEWRKVN